MTIDGTHIRYLGAALRGLEVQRQAYEHNIANVETPGFKARRVSFEDSLRAAIDRQDLRGFSPTTSLSTEPTRIDGSNVDLADEVTALELNALQQSLVTEALNGWFTRTRTAIGS
ncbi:MAG: flagellar biosynthesis protein FlgB [Actinomycetota bacterium]